MIVKIYNYVPKDIELEADEHLLSLDESMGLLMIMKKDPRIAKKAVVYGRDVTDLDKLTVDQTINALILLAEKLKTENPDDFIETYQLEFCEELPEGINQPTRRLCL